MAKKPEFLKQVWKEKQSGKSHSRFLIYFIATIINTVWYYMRERHIEPDK